MQMLSPLALGGQMNGLTLNFFNGGGLTANPLMGRGFGADSFNPTAELFDRGQGGGFLPAFLLGNQFGALGGGGMVPGMGFGGFPGMGGGFPGLGGGFPGLGGFPGMGGGLNGLGQGGMMQQMMQMFAMMMMMMMAMQQGAGRGQQGGPGQGFPGAGQPIGMQGPGQNGQNGPGQGIELQKGQTHTTPGGSTISWQGDEVKVKEPGGGSQSHPTGGGGQQGQGGNCSFAMAMAYNSQQNSWAMAAAGAGFGGPAGICGCHHGSEQPAQARDWKVWGDPHKTNPDGSKSEDFSRKNGMFTLQDGTRVVMEADNPQGVVNKVKIFPPGAQLGGFDQNQTTNYTDNDRDGKWDNNGNQTVAQGQQQQQPNFGFSPFGNQLF